MTITLSKIKKADVIVRPHHESELLKLLSAGISLTDIVKSINPKYGILFKFLPDQMLNDEQKASKAKAITKEQKKIAKLREEYLAEQGKAQKQSWEDIYSELIDPPNLVHYST